MRSLPVAICFLLFVLSACSSEEGRIAGRDLVFPGIGEYGIFDPFLACDPDTGRIWMSYSAVDASGWVSNRRISTRLAFSDDAGASWEDAGITVNDSVDFTDGEYRITWEQEVSSLCLDTNAPPAQRWKMVWHRYAAVGEARLFEHGWIGMKCAASPEELASASERKLFVGSNYNSTNDTVIGAPEIRLDQLDPALNSCAVFSEPALFVSGTNLYACLLGGEVNPADGRIVLLKYLRSADTWEYRGSFLTNSTDGPLLGFDGYSAPALYAKNGTNYLMVSPQTNDRYLGTLVFAVRNLEDASLVRVDGVPPVFLSLSGAGGSHNGAAGYIPQASGCGILYSELILQEPFQFRIVASGVNP